MKLWAVIIKPYFNKHEIEYLFYNIIFSNTFSYISWSQLPKLLHTVQCRCKTFGHDDVPVYLKPDIVRNLKLTLVYKLLFMANNKLVLLNEY